MRIMTEQNLRDAFSGESQAHMKYQIYSSVAEKEGFPMWPACSKQLPMLSWYTHATT